MKTNQQHFKRPAFPPRPHPSERDAEIIRLVHRHRFLRSNQVVSLLLGREPGLLRRVTLLYHQGYLERPRAQIGFNGGNRSIVYGLGNKGARLLRDRFGIETGVRSWNDKNQAVGRVYLDHALMVSDFMVALELACRHRPEIKLLYDDELDLKIERRPLSWRAKLPNGTKLGVIPDRVFALEYADKSGLPQRAYFFLEADRGTMPVMRRSLDQTSFYRKLLAYEATWVNKVHQRYLGLPRFRVLTVAQTPKRVESLLKACRQLKRGHGLFLFADKSVIEKDLLSDVWLSAKTGELTSLVDLPPAAVPAVS